MVDYGNNVHSTAVVTSDSLLIDVSNQEQILQWSQEPATGPHS